MNFGPGQLILENQFGEQSFNKVSGLLLTGSGAPVNGTTGDEVSPKGGLYFDITNGTLYQNTGTISASVWVLVPTGAASVAATAQTLSAAGAISTSTPLTNLANATGGDLAATLAAPSSQDGQIKILKMTVRTTHDFTLAMTNIAMSGGYTPTGTTTMTFGAVGQSAVLMAVGSKWVYLGGSAVVS
jgi:hypothetical protein